MCRVCRSVQCVEVCAVCRGVCRVCARVYDRRSILQGRHGGKCEGSGIGGGRGADSGGENVRVHVFFLGKRRRGRRGGGLGLWGLEEKIRRLDSGNKNRRKGGFEKNEDLS